MGDGDRAQAPGERHLALIVEVLVTEEEHLVAGEVLADAIDLAGVQVGGEVDAVDLGADRPRDGLAWTFDSMVVMRRSFALDGAVAGSTPGSSTANVHDQSGWCAPRGARRPRPAAARTSAPTATISPRLIVTAGQPVTSQPSYGE